ncbi:thermonuclease family protein [Aquibacillus rhizosphaerae]|uniref:Thermonuclease family protein n=1 Tax=Aquibacillus rhizosphaerae TaxID=3051431 RepID=A0ABT7L4G9_9BACI|nr:thermonuclease family protein [Aquibacillus sp. LR5S19]MDL4839500.1 thermonuclease family protein [Aquibacillus sp. LR5S19]
MKTSEKGSTQVAVEPESTFQIASNLDIALVKRVIDADTIEVYVNGNVVDVRLLLIDAPETVHPDIPDEAFGAEAVARARQILIGKQVQLEYDGPRYDDYGRLLAYVWVDGVMLNELLLEEGLAHVAYVYHPPYKYYQRYVKAQERAKVGWKGIWGRSVLNRT